jgi:MFS transporter, DHA2 family, multidrug resistance protein
LESKILWPCATILSDRTNLHFLRLAEHLNTTNAGILGLIQRVSAKFATAHAGDLLHGHAAAVKQLRAVTYREARVQAFADALLAMAICLAIAAILVPLMRKVIASPATATAGH